MPGLFAYISSASATHVGRVRERNEDALVDLPASGVFGVFDGMGGAAAGDVASRMAADAVRAAFAAEPDESVLFRTRVIALRAAIDEASRGIRAMAHARGAQGSGTTAAVLLFDPSDRRRAAVLHAGDSRVYRIRQGRLERLTRDHSFVEAAGIEHEAEVPPMLRGIVTRAVGLDDEVVLDESPVEVGEEDVFLLCSDGLSKMLPDQVLSSIIAHVAPQGLQECVARLIAGANDAGGQDNITAILVSAGRLPAQPAVLPVSTAGETLADQPAALFSEKSSSPVSRWGGWRLLVHAAWPVGLAALAIMASWLGSRWGASSETAHRAGPPVGQVEPLPAAPSAAPVGQETGTSAEAFAANALDALRSGQWSLVESAVDDAVDEGTGRGDELLELPVYALWSPLWRAAKGSDAAVFHEKLAGLTRLAAAMRTGVEPVVAPCETADLYVLHWQAAGDAIRMGVLEAARTAGKWLALFHAAGIIDDDDPYAAQVAEAMAGVNRAVADAGLPWVPMRLHGAKAIHAAWARLHAATAGLATAVLDRMAQSVPPDAAAGDDPGLALRKGLVSTWTGAARNYAAWSAGEGPRLLLAYAAALAENAAQR